MEDITLEKTPKGDGESKNNIQTNEYDIDDDGATNTTDVVKKFSDANGGDNLKKKHCTPTKELFGKISFLCMFSIQLIQGMACGDAYFMPSKQKNAKIIAYVFWPLVSVCMAYLWMLFIAKVGNRYATTISCMIQAVGCLLKVAPQTTCILIGQYVLYIGARATLLVIVNHFFQKNTWSTAKIFSISAQYCIIVPLIGFAITAPWSGMAIVIYPLRIVLAICFIILAVCSFIFFPKIGKWCYDHETFVTTFGKRMPETSSFTPGNDDATPSSSLADEAGTNEQPVTHLSHMSLLYRITADMIAVTLQRKTVSLLLTFCSAGCCFLCMSVVCDVKVHNMRGPDSPNIAFVASVCGGAGSYVAISLLSKAWGIQKRLTVACLLCSVVGCAVFFVTATFAPDVEDWGGIPLFFLECFVIGAGTIPPFICSLIEFATTSTPANPMISTCVAISFLVTAKIGIIMCMFFCPANAIAAIFCILCTTAACSLLASSPWVVDVTTK
jgi:hypothetical protein